MPLDRFHITAASRIMLPTYLVFFTVIGIGYIIGFRIGDAPMLRFANELMPIQLWGSVFVMCGLLMGLAMKRRDRTMYRYALLVCGVSMAIWTGIAVVGIFFETVTLSAWVWPFLAMQAVRATDRSLAKGELDPIRRVA